MRQQIDVSSGAEIIVEPREDPHHADRQSDHDERPAEPVCDTPDRRPAARPKHKTNDEYAARAPDEKNEEGDDIHGLYAAARLNSAPGRDCGTTPAYAGASVRTS